MTKEVLLMLNDHNTAFRTGNKDLYSAATSNLKRKASRMLRHSTNRGEKNTSTMQPPVVYGKTIRPSQITEALMTHSKAAAPHWLRSSITF